MPGAPTIYSSFTGYQPVRFVRVRNGDLFAFDGISRGMRWDGCASSGWPAGIDPPANTSGPQVVLVPGGAATAGSYLLAWRFVDITLGTDRQPNGVPSNLSPMTTALATDGDGFQWSFTPSYPTPARISAIELYRSTSDEATILYLVASLGFTGSVATIGNSSGSCLVTTSAPHKLLVGAKVAIASSSVSGYNTTHTITSVGSATTFVTNIAHTSDATGGTWTLAGYNEPVGITGLITSATATGGYTTGTVTTNGTTTLVGSGTTWTQAMVGENITVSGETATFQIASVQSTTSLTLSQPAVTSASGLSYSILGRVIYTVSSGHGLKVGAIINVTNVVFTSGGQIGAGYNIQQTVTAVASTTITTNVPYSADTVGGRWTLAGYAQPPASGSTGAGLITVGTNSNGNPIFTTSAPHGLYVGQLVSISGTSVPDYNVVQQVTSIPTTTTFTTNLPYESDIQAPYSTGTVTTNGTAILAGSGTSWTQAMVGQYITISGETLQFTVAAVSSATSLTLSQAAATSSSGLSYSIPAGFFAQAAFDDNTLASQTSTGDGVYPQLPILFPDGSTNANRFVSPPNFCPYAVWFQDRLLMAGGVRYTAGTVTTNGTTTLTGSGTDWLTAWSDGNREVVIEGESEPFGITAVASATSLTLDHAATTSAGSLSYCIRPAAALRNQIRYSESDEPESMQDQNTITVQENTGDDDDITGLLRHGAHVYVLKERHLYAVQYIRQPNIDAQVYLIADRGGVSDRCCAWQDGLVYILDQKGVYMFNGVVTQEMATPIADLWYNQLLDFANSQWWFAVSDVQRRLIFFYVGFKADESTRPMRALVLHTDSGAWSIDNHVWELGGGCTAPLDGEARVFLGKENDTVCLAGEGFSDIVTAAITGTATSADSSSLTDSGASFTDAVLDAPLAIVAGTGKGQLAKITARTSTKLTISGTWTTTPDTTSQYAVGGIQWSHQSGMMEYPVSDSKSKRSVNLYWKPTANPATLDLWVYDDYATSPIVMQVPQQIRPGLTTTQGSPDIVLDMALNRSPLGPSGGYNEYYYGGVLEDRAQANRYQTIGLRGFQTLDPIRIYQYEIQGAEP